MKTKQVSYLVVAAAFMWMILLLGRPGATSAASTTPTPPLPTWTPGPPPAKTPVQDSADAYGETAKVTLLVRCAPPTDACRASLATVWTQVQAQAADGTWSPVSGWWGRLDEINGNTGQKAWWFGTADVSTLRWQVFSHEGGDLLATSSPFNPTVVGGEQVVTLTDGPILLPATGAPALVLAVVFVLVGIVVASTRLRRRKSLPG
jgi:hypothetical protein